MLLITGTGRSGTHFISKVLKQIGYDVPHESVGKRGTASWKHIVPGTFVYIGKNREVEIDASGFSRTLHQVRHPLKVIASMHTFSKSTWAHMAKYIEVDLEAAPALRGMQAWVRWNQLIEPQADWRFQIEKIKQVFPEFCHHAGIEVAKFPTVPHEARDSRVSRFDALYWEDLVAADPAMAEEVRALAIRYGYEDIATAPPPALKRPKRSLLRRLFKS